MAIGRHLILWLNAVLVFAGEPGAALHPWGSPKANEPGLKVITYQAFECGYLPRIKLSRWVAYRYFWTPAARLPRYKGRFVPDTIRLKKHEAGFPAAYDSVPGFIRHPIDKGHLAPDAAIKVFGRKAQQETYFLTNIIPQFASCNRFIWAALEERIRRWADSDDTVWAVVGPVFYPGEDTFWLGTHNIAIPHALYYVVARRQPTAVIAFIVPNDSIRRTGRSLPRFLVSVDSVEKLTGLDIFPALPESLERLVPLQLWDVR